jgi:hypothetical protein
MKQKSRLIFILCVFLLSGCVKTRNSITLNDTDICIPPTESFVYSAAPNLETLPGEEGMQISPNWEIELETNDSLITTRKNNNEVELWFEENRIEENENPDFSNFLVYKPESKQWIRISGEIEQSGIFVKHIIMGFDDTVWGVINFDSFSLKEGTHRLPVLSKLNETTQRFEFVEETASIPYTVNYQSSSDSNYWVSVVISQENLIWFFVPNDAIYIYDPVKNSIERDFELKEYIPANPVLAPNGDIYFVDQKSIFEKGFISSSSDVQINKINRQKNQIEQIPIRLDPWPPFKQIVVDHNGWLWLDALGYLDDQGRLYQLEKSSIFLVPFFESGMDYRWSTPQILFESSDGRLWFNSLNGLAWLDFSERQWCWISTSQSKAIEDDNHVLWMTAYGKLHKREITPID